MPPSWAMVIARRASVTVSMAAETTGILSRIWRVSWLDKRDFARQHIRVGRHQQDVVEGECFLEDAHEGVHVVRLRGGALYLARRGCGKPLSFRSMASRAKRLPAARPRARRLQRLAAQPRGARPAGARLPHAVARGRDLQFRAARAPATGISRSRTPPPRCAAPCSGSEICCAALHARDGLKVLVRARVSLYEPRGDYQLIVDHMEDAGLGALQRAFEELSARLAAEGLFAAERKRPLPTLPRRIGVITSPTRRRAARHPARARAALSRGGRADLSGAGAGRRRAAEIAAALETGVRARRMRRADPGPRRRLAGRSVGLQRRALGPRHRRLADPGRQRRRPRDRFHHRRFRRRCARADALGGGGTGGSRRRGMARRPSRGSASRLQRGMRRRLGAARAFALARPAARRW